jgi:hypothetical protein
MDSTSKLGGDQSPKFVAELAERVGDTLTASAARALLDLKMSGISPERIQELGQKSSQGTLTKEEYIEYHTYSQLRLFLAILHGKARLALQSQANP